jgi:Mg-chelatase subunit ChlD
LWRGLDNCPSYEIITGTLYSTIAQGATNIAGGMAWGLEDLEPPPDGHGRSTAIQVMVLITDGQANEADPEASNVRADMWPPYNTVDDKDHVIAYAYQARERAILIYSISLGLDADRELLEEAANITYGGYYHAVTSEELDEIFQEIADNIFLRLVE